MRTQYTEVDEGENTTFTLKVQNYPNLVMTVSANRDEDGYSQGISDMYDMFTRIELMFQATAHLNEEQLQAMIPHYPTGTTIWEVEARENVLVIKERQDAYQLHGDWYYRTEGHAERAYYRTFVTYEAAVDYAKERTEDNLKRYRDNQECLISTIAAHEKFLRSLSCT